ncbi:MAG TPA: hypothetical protein VLA92_00725 [Candidatus Saccharimonadales bacterium]|nr:hypothetical protein [Candidatus Saccharimonadales bacterium]
MVQVQKINPVVRAILVVGAVAGLVVGVTFAALNSQATLTGNTISANAGLQLSTDGGTTYGSSVDGLDFSNVVLGDTNGVSKSFKVKNITSSAMSLSLRVPTAPVFTGGTVDQTKVKVSLACTSPTMTLSPVTLTGMVNAEANVTGNLTAGATADCSLTVAFDTDAVTGGATVTSDAFNIRFTGIGV